MPKLYITECVMQGLMPAVAEQSIDIDVESKPSAAFNEKTKFVMVHSEVPCSLAFGVEPKADAKYHRLGEEQDRWYSVQTGHRIAVVSNDGGED